MNQLKDRNELEQTLPEETNPVKPAAGKLIFSELWQEFLLDLLIATVLGLLIYRYSQSSGWAIIASLCILFAGITKQGLKHLFKQFKPIYCKCPPWMKIFIKTIPIGLVSLVGLVKFCGPPLGIFSTMVLMVVMTTIFWLNQSDVPRF
ncbi:MAG: hypothetical protein R3C11_19890 [Planctomycetaceae bacterium]